MAVKRASSQRKFTTDKMSCALTAELVSVFDKLQNVPSLIAELLMFSSLTLESTSADMHRRTLITRRSSEAWQTITRPRHHVTTSIVCTQTAMLTSESIVTSRTLCQQPVTTATVTLTTRLTPASQLAIHELTRLKGRCSTSTGAK